LPCALIPAESGDKDYTKMPNSTAEIVFTLVPPVLTLNSVQGSIGIMLLLTTFCECIATNSIIFVLFASCFRCRRSTECQTSITVLSEC